MVNALAMKNAAKMDVVDQYVQTQFFHRTFMVIE
jgi:hypothetical protein